jgi:hypothetical protein
VQESYDDLEADLGEAVSSYLMSLESADEPVDESYDFRDALDDAFFSSWAKKHRLTYLGHGVDRVVLEIPDGVLKIAYGGNGDGQNLGEVRVWGTAPQGLRRWLVPVLRFDPNGRWLIAEKAIPSVSGEIPDSAPLALFNQFGLTDFRPENFDVQGRLLDYGTVDWEVFDGRAAYAQGRSERLPDTSRPVIFVDLDETLVRAESWGLYGNRDPLDVLAESAVRYEQRSGSSLIARRLLAIARESVQLRGAPTVTFEASDGPSTYSVIVRPNIREMLESLQRVGELHLLTAGSRVYGERVLNAANLRGYFGDVYSLKDQPDLSWAANRPWVLIDDLSPTANGPVGKCRLVDPSADPEQHVVQVDRFTLGSDGEGFDEVVAAIEQRFGVGLASSTHEALTSVEWDLPYSFAVKSEADSIQWFIRRAKSAYERNTEPTGLFESTGFDYPTSLRTYSALESPGGTKLLLDVISRMGGKT